MTTIKLDNLYPVGSDLFSDSETYMTDLTEEELGTQGGAISTPVCSVVVLVTYSAAIIYSAAKSNPKSPHRPQ